MSAIIDAIEDFIDDVIEAVEDLVQVVWDAIVEPILEPIFGIFGIVDETVVTVQHLSSAVYDTNTTNVVSAGLTRAVMKKIETDTSYFPNYMEQIYKTKAQIRAYYRYGDLGLYTYGLPQLKIKGTIVNYNNVQDALDAEFGSTHTVLFVQSRNPRPIDWFRYTLQAAPENYKPWLNTLTATDGYGVSWDDWTLNTVTYNAGPDNFTINISRNAAEAKFWITGPKQITEGDTAVYTIWCNRTVPAGETLQINLGYSGTAVDGVDYTQVASVNMLENTDTVDVSIVTAETANADRNYTISISSIPNTGGVFEEVTIHTPNSVFTTITDDDTLQLTMPDIFVDEANTTIIIPVKLEQTAPSGAFTVNYAFTDLGTTVGGTDYDNTTGTLNFAGTVGEVQNISVDIFADIVDDDFEQFEVSLTNLVSSDVIDITAVSTVTIRDGTSDPAPTTIVVPNTSITKPNYVRESSLIVQYEDDFEPPGEYRWWIYPHSDLTYDLLPTTQTISNLEMLPMAILRKNKQSINVSPGEGSPLYLSTKQLMARASLQLSEFLDAINSNPDIGVVDDAYLNFSVSPKHTNRVVSKILWLQWYAMVVEAGLSSNKAEYTATISIGDIENAIVWTQHTYAFGNVGVVTTEGEYIHSSLGTTLTIQYQRTATEYDEIVLSNLNGMAAINYQTYHEVALFNLEDNEFTIPLSWDIFKDLSAEEQMEVLQYIVRVSFNAINITELEWYETAAFFELLEFAAIVVTVITLGSTSSFLQFGLALVETYVINLAIAELIIYVAELTGNEELAALVGVIAAVYLSDPTKFSFDQLLQADQLIDLSTDFAENLQFVENIEAQQLAEDLYAAAEESRERVEEAMQNQEGAKAVGVDSQFLIALQSVDTTYFPAIQGQYNYDQLYNYDSLVGNWHSQTLQTGVT